MRWIVVVCTLAGSAIASEGIFHGETLVGWSADVATWKPLAKYKLGGTFGAARKRFEAAYELKAAGSLLPQEKQRCKGGAWSVVRKKDKQVVHENKPGNDHCFGVVGGYLDESGKHALVKFHEEWAWTDQGEYMFEGADRYELVELP